MNKLKELHHMGFDISWKLILIGLQSKKTEAWQLSRKEIIDYLITQLEGSENQTREKQVISLICIAEDDEAFGRKLQCLAEDDPSDVALQKRKWCAYFLKQILDANIQDSVQGLLELLFFWCNIGDRARCPHDLMEKIPPEEFFTDSNYRSVLSQNRNWLQREVKSIISKEK